MLAFPPEFEQNIRRRHGEAGDQWLAQLPSKIRQWMETRKLQLDGVFCQSGQHMLYSLFDNHGRAMILKTGFPTAAWQTQINAQRAFSGRRCVPLTDADENTGMALMPRLTPGVALEDFNHPDTACRILADVICALHDPPLKGGGFPHLQDWFAALSASRDTFAQRCPPHYQSLLPRAESLWQTLLQSTSGEHLLHGDLHHGNLLRDLDKGWTAIDPKGVMGDPAYEPARFLYNPWNTLLAAQDPKATTERRVENLSRRLGHDPARLLAWAFVDCVLSAWWCLEDGDDAGAGYVLGCARLFDELLS